MSRPAVLIVVVLAACASASPASPLASVPACPRDAKVSGGRCTCAPDRPALLGACVEPGVRDAYCGPAAARGTGPCAFRTCPADQAVDDHGRCLSPSAVVRSGPACGASAALVVSSGHAVCVPPDAACPRGTRAAAGACNGPPSCPAGSLWTGSACRPVVTAGPRGPVVDLGAWTTLVLGPSGGPGTPELCRPLEAAPPTLGVARGEHVDVVLDIALRLPDQDVSRVFASVEARDGSGKALQGPATALAGASVDALVEALRSLGGESSSAAVEVEVRCSVASL